MKVLLDCRYVRTDHHDGISRYSVGIATALARLHPVELLVCDTGQLAHLPDVPWHLVSAPTSVREPFVAHQVNRLHPDVVFTPMQTMGGWGRTYPLVLTLHDVIYHHHRTPPRELPAWLRALWRAYHLTWWPQRLLVERADAVVTVSATTAGAIAGHHLTHRAVSVVANAADPPAPGARAGQGAAPQRARTGGQRTLVYMGSFMPYKNVETLVRAMAELPGYRLHLMSRIRPADRARLDAAAGAHARHRLVFHDGTSEDGYRQVLDQASALLSASREEGFGIPLLEAMSAGVPVVVSDIAIFREVCAEAAVYARPDDSAAFAAAVRALEEPARWRARSRAGCEQAARFTWQSSAQTLLEVLRSAASPTTNP